MNNAQRYPNLGRTGLSMQDFALIIFSLLI